MHTRTETETRILREEAERLARMNWRRTRIAQTLGVPLHTLAKWAYEGGWRAKDIAAEGEAERLAALNEQIAARRAQDARLACGRLAAPAELMEYKSRQYGGPLPGDRDYVEPPQPDARPDTRYPAEDPDHGPWEPDKKLPKFLTRGGPEDERVCWAAPQLWARTPPWAPGNEFEAPEAASLWLAEDLMRQGLLVEAERALRFTRNWLKISKQVFDKQDEEDARRREYLERQEEERAREAARRKALGLPDPNEAFEAHVQTLRAARSNGNTATLQQSNPVESDLG